MSLIFVLLGSALNLLSQNLKADVASINNTYKSLQKMSFTFELNMFENYQTKKIYYTQSGSIQKNGKNYLQKFEDTECINTPAYSIIIDRDEKEVVYAPKKTNFSYDDPSLALDLDSVLLFCKNSHFKKTSEEMACYDFVMIDAYPGYNQITLYFDPTTYLIQKIVFYCEEEDISVDNQPEKLAKARIELNYKNIDSKPEFINSDFSYEKYLTKSGKTFVLKPELKNYHLTVLSF